jgi:hypothetical protein
MTPELKILIAALVLCSIVVFVAEVITPMLSDQEPRRRIH